MSESLKRHSRLGVASFAIAIGVPVTLVLLLVTTLLLGSRKGSIGSYIAFGMILFGTVAPGLHIIGSILGAAGLLSNKTQNLYPILGTVLNTMLGISGVLLIGLIIKNLSFGFH